MPKTIILLNGPPRSGKDTAAEIIKKNNPGAEIIRMADPLLQCLHSVFPKIKDYESEKGNIICGELTGRQWIIKLAEEFIKPTVGKDAFVNIVIDKIAASQAQIIIIPDLGFDEELNAIADYNAVLIRIYKNGCDFKADSRKYLYSDKCKCIEIENNGTIEDYEKIISLSVYF